MVIHLNEVIEKAKKEKHEITSELIKRTEESLLQEKR